MLDRKALEALGCWKGYRLERVEWPQGEHRTLSLYLKPVSKVMHCQQCGTRCTQIHETALRAAFAIFRCSNIGWFCMCRAGACGAIAAAARD